MQTLPVIEPWFRALPETTQQQIFALARIINVRAGQRLFSRGDAADAWYLVLDGALRVTQTTGQGQETILDFLAPGNWFGEMALLDGLRRTHDVTAQVDTVLYRVSKGDFHQLLLAHSELQQGLLIQSCHRQRRMMEEVSAQSLQPLEQRLANWLLRLTDKFGLPYGQGILVSLTLSQEMLAMLVGVTRQRVSQLLKHWQRQGILEQHYGRLYIYNRSALSRIGYEQIQSGTDQFQPPLAPPCLSQQAS